MNSAYLDAWAEIQQRQEEEEQYLEWAQQYEAETKLILMGAPRPLTVAGENDVITGK